MIIPEGSKIVIYDLSFDARETGITTNRDIDVLDDCVMLFDGYLCCTDDDCVEKIDDNTYQIKVYKQDAFCIKDGVLHQSISDAD